MSAVRRKSTAVRAPSSLRYEAMSAGESSKAASPSASLSSAQKASTSRRIAEQKALLAAASQTHHSLPPAMFSSPSLQSLIYATSNDRYPGAPGTLLHRAKLEAARALAASKREAQREAERRDEMKRLGILSVGGNRKRGGNGHSNGNGNAAETGSNGRSSRFNTPPGAERARRSAASATVASAAAANGNINGLPNGASSSASSNGSTSRRNGANGTRHNLGNAIDHNSLPVPGGANATQPPQNAGGSSSSQTSPSSPLLSASGRLRRPATGSRGASPMPLTGPPGPRGTRSPVVANMDVDDGASAGSNVVDPVVVPAV